MSARLDLKYDVYDIIGEGASGCVFAAMRKNDQRQVAIKKLQKLRVPDNRLAIEPRLKNRPVPMEVYIHTRVSHRNIIKLLDFFEDEDNFYIVTERVKSKSTCQDLFDFIDKNGPLSQETILKIAKQVASALSYLQSKYVYHLDIKDENIVVDEDLNIKLIDFGSAHIVKTKDQKFARFFGTLEFASPSILEGCTYQPQKTEVWAFGTLLWTMMHGSSPYGGVGNIMQNIRTSHTKRADVSQDLMNLLEQMLDRNEKTRPCLEQITYIIKEW